ncbi:MAG: methyltransferase domain-containing protein [Candidatus Lokiarchaeota archaeon]|nr:methyltransferase domain-containing protein [Candidatus Lokiarchaeota archaeon]
MTQKAGEVIIFNNPTDNNDVSKPEQLVNLIFSKKNKQTKHYLEEIRSLLLSAMKNANISSLKSSIFWFYVNRVISKGVKARKSLLEIECILRAFIKKRANGEINTKHIAFNRAKLNFENIRKYLTGERILDLGAGDGLLALQIKINLAKEVILVDVVDYNESGLPLILCKPEAELPLKNNEVDTTILYTVLHHSNNPKQLLEEATRVTKNRLIIKEAYIDDDKIYMTNSFFDWFYNRVIGHQDINVPLNFLKIEEWKKILNSCGFQIIQTDYVGIDEPLVPEHHIFIIAEKIN